MECLSRFDYSIQYVKGRLKDALSRYYESDTWYNTHPEDIYINADIWLNKDMDDVMEEPCDKVKEKTTALHALRVKGTLETCQSKCLLDKQEVRDLEVVQIAAGMDQPLPTDNMPVDNVEDPTVHESQVKHQNL